jgi:hypothetical protein
MFASVIMPKDSGGLMQPLDPEVYAELLKVYEDNDYNLIVDYKNYTSTFVLKEEPKNDRT